MVRWKIAVTTAPRHPNFLDQTLVSLHAAGWDYENITVYAEPGSTPSVLPVTESLNVTKVGPYLNWRQALWRLSESDCEYVAIVQDDLAFRPGLRAYLDDTMRDTAVFSPYLSRKDGHALAPVKEDWHLCNSGWNYCGACFFAMPRSLAVTLHKGLPERVPENKHIDAVVAHFLKTHELLLYVHSPSLVQHLADAHSTMGYGANPFCRTAHRYTEEPLEPSE